MKPELKDDVIVESVEEITLEEVKKVPNESHGHLEKSEESKKSKEFKKDAKQVKRV